MPSQPSLRSPLPLTLPLLLLAAVLLSWPRPAAAAPRKEIPSFIHVCKRNDPHLEDCILNSLEKIRPKLVSGIPEMNVQPIEPLIIPELVIKPSPQFQAVGHDVQVYGGSDFKVTHLKVDINDTALSFNAEITLPKLSFTSEYTVDGRILALPIKGKGLLTANVTDIKGTLNLLGRITKRKGSEYLRFYESEMKLLIISPIKIHLDNLFNGDKALGEATNAALNANSEDMKEVVVPVGERVVAQFAIDTANKIATVFPLDQLLPRE